jgi:Tol biopolymer transport system component
MIKQISNKLIFAAVHRMAGNLRSITMRRFTRLILVLAGLTLVLSGPLSVFPGSSVISVQQASAAFPGANGKIAFASNRDDDGPFQIYVMDVDGSNQTNLSNSPFSDGLPAWSSDGSKLAFTRTGAGQVDIFVMDADGSNQINLTNHSSFDSQPSWSPDGSKIAFWSNRAGQGDIFVIDVDGSNPVNLTNHPSFETGPAWSPDGSRIAFLSRRDLAIGQQIFVMDADGSNVINITDHPSVQYDPAWSPDGSRIAFTSDRGRSGGRTDAYVMDADGSNQTRLTTELDYQAYSPDWSPDGTMITLRIDTETSGNIYVMDADGGNQTNLTNQKDNYNLSPSWQPLPDECALLLVPGIAGTYSANMTHDVLWLVNRGAHPDQLQIDPLGRVYNDLITTLENVGYTQGEDFFVVNYDWRLPPAPYDGTIDGQISGLTGASITNATFAHSVDYFGHYLRLAVEANEADAPDSELDCVDVIAHSTGGLVTRSYIQSTAYEDTFMTSDGERTLPRVNEFIMLGVPNRGASKAWNPLNDNWGIDPAYQLVLSKIVNRAWEKVVRWNIHINGPDQTITRATITNAEGEYDPMLFIEQYVPTIGSLLATYDFLDSGDGFDNVNDDPNLRNNVLLDLNDGFDLSGTVDPSPFADHSTVTAIYGTDLPTATGVIQRIGPDGGEKAILPFSNFLARDPELNEIWYQDIQPPISGDGTVPIDSAVGQFFGDERVSLIPLSAATTSGSTDHTGLVSNPDVQATMLSILGRSYEPGDLATGTSAGLTALSVIFDPVEGFVIDGDGNRLGYSSATGPLSEIPGSVWFGNGDGFGLVHEPLALPLTLELSGLGEDHYVMVSFAHEGETGGVISEGTLGMGEEVFLPIPLGDEPPDDPGEESTPAEQLLKLITQLSDMDLHQGIKNSRLSQLHAAGRSLERDNTNAACNQLRAFINSVDAQSGEHFSKEQADELMEPAARIRAALEC